MKLSILIPTYNRCSELAECLSSLYSACLYHGTSQTEQELTIEVIISNNASPDQTEKVLENFKIIFAKLEKVNYIYYNQKKNIGGVSNMRFLLDVATGNFLIWLTDDDLALPHTITRIAKALKDTQADFLHTGLIVNNIRSLSCYYSGVANKNANKSQAFIDLFLISNVYTGTITSKQLASNYLKLTPTSNNTGAYPSLELLSLSQNPANIPMPLFIHTWENQTYWGIDVDESSGINRAISLFKSKVKALNFNTNRDLKFISLAYRIKAYIGLLPPTKDLYSSEFCRIFGRTHFLGETINILIKLFGGKAIAFLLKILP